MKNTNKNSVGKYMIIKDLNFSDFMKDELGNIKLYNDIDDAYDVCGINEFEDVLICKIEYNHVEPVRGGKERRRK